jgi:twinkle protein
MKNFIEWSTLDLKGKTSGTIKIKCPECNDRRTNKSDKSLQVNIAGGFGKCHYCESLTFKESIKRETEIKYTLPVQTWSNYTSLSDNLVKWVEDTRKIKQFVLNELNVTEEKYFQPALGKEVNNIVFNY